MEKEKAQGPQTLKIVFLTLFLDLVGFSIIFPLFPAILDYYLPTDPSESNLLSSFIGPIFQLAESTGHQNPKFITTVLFGGILGSIYSILQFIFAPIWGSLSDKYGRKKLLLITISGLALSYLIWGFAGNFWILIIARLVGGVMSGNISVASAIVADVTPKEKRTSGMAIIGVAFGLGFIMGPAIGGILAQFNLLNAFPSLEHYGINPFSLTAFFSLFLSLLNLIWVNFKLKETLPSQVRKKTKAEPFKIFKLFNYGTVDSKQLNLTYLIFMIAFSGMEFTLTFFAVDRFLFSTFQNGMMFVYIGIILILAQGVLVRRLSPKVGPYNLSLSGLFLSIIAFVLLSFSNTLLLFFSALTVMSLSIGLCSPSMSALASLFAKPEEQGALLGLFRSAGSFARASGPILAALSYFFYGPQITYLVGSIVVIFAYIKMARLSKPSH
jgi:MFS family permease